GGALDSGENRLGLRGVSSGVQRFGHLVEVVADLPEVPPQCEQLLQHLFLARDVRSGALQVAGSVESRAGKEPGHARVAHGGCPEEELVLVVVHAAAGLVHTLLLITQTFTLLHTGRRRGSVSAVGAVAGTRFFPLRMRSALGRILTDRRLLVPIRSRRCRRGRGRSIAPDGSNAPAPTCSAWGRIGRQGFLGGHGVFVVRGLHGAFRVGAWSGVLVRRGSAGWMAGYGFELGLELADDSSDAVAGDGVASGAQGVLNPVASDAAGLPVDAASVLEDDLVGGTGFAGVALLPGSRFPLVSARRAARSVARERPALFSFCPCGQPGLRAGRLRAGSRRD